MVVNDRDTSGRFTGSVDDADVIAAVRAHDPAATSEIGEELGISRQGADRRLRSLRDAGDVSSKKIGASLVWFIPRDRGRPESDESDARAGAVGDATDGAADPPADARGAETGFSTDNLQGDADTTLDELADGSDGIDRDAWRARLADTLAGSGALADRRADAILNMYDHLREHGAATNDELRAVVDADAVGYKDAGSVWANMVKGKDTLRALPGVEKPAPGRNDPWRYDAEEDA